MSALDARDVLNLPQDGVGGVASRPSKKQKTAGLGLGAGASRNLKGLAREVQSLGGESSISIVPQLMSNIKKRRLANRKPAARWEMRQFTNSARDDPSLVLTHWRRKTAAGATATGEAPKNGDAADAAAESAESQAMPDADQKPMDDSAFAKFNVKVVVPQYSDDQYEANLQHPDWTKEETDYLLELVQDYDLRWPLIWDRYDYRENDGAEAKNEDSDDKALVSAGGTESSSTRTMEDLKVRYYEIAAKMMAVQKPSQYMTQTEYNLHGIMANFNPEKEKQRKAFANNALMRSREEVREEEALLFEVRRIMDRTEKTNEERRELYHRLEFPHSDQDISAFKTSTGLQTLLQNLAYNNEKNKKRKSLANGEASSPAPPGAGPSGAGASGGDAGGNRRDSIAAAGASAQNNRRESVSQNEKTSASAAAAATAAAAAAAAAEATAPATPLSATPTASGKNNKKGAAQIERRKLTDQEQDVYGVTYHDRLGSGPTFRYEKINKLFTHKSGQQQLRITNILNELEMPNRLFMPTSAVTTQFEVLVNGVVQLVDLRKVSDKLDSEIKIEEQRKAERERLKAIASGQADEEDSGDKEEAKDGDDKEEEETAKDTKDSKDKDHKKKVVVTEEAVSTKEEDGDTGHDTRTRSGSRPGSSNSNAAAASHKRSASVLSVSSDKSSKRQKK